MDIGGVGWICWLGFEMWLGFGGDDDGGIMGRKRGKDQLLWLSATKGVLTRLVRLDWDWNWIGLMDG